MKYFQQNWDETVKEQQKFSYDFYKNSSINIQTAHTLGALVSGIVNEVSHVLLYHHTHRENTPVSYEWKF